MLDQDRRPRRIIYGLDFFAFADDQPGVGVGNFDKSRFSPDYNPWTYHAQNLVSMYAINESYKVIESALTGVKQAVDPNAAVGELGNGYMFAHTLWSAAQPPRAGAQQRIVDSLESFEQILRRARRANVTMTIVFLPTHVLHQEALHRSGKGELIEAWKRRVTLIAQRVGEGDIELWDFENYNPVTTETVPPIGDLKHSMHWHYDSVHFTPEVGKTILDQLLDYSRDKSNELNLVGVRLMPDNIDEYLATVRYQRQAYQIDRSDQIAFLDKILSIPPPRTAR
jgi:hypothetical protein